MSNAVIAALFGGGALFAAISSASAAPTQPAAQGVATIQLHAELSGDEAKMMLSGLDAIGHGHIGAAYNSSMGTVTLLDISPSTSPAVMDYLSRLDVELSRHVRVRVQEIKLANPEAQRKVSSGPAVVTDVAAFSALLTSAGGTRVVVDGSAVVRNRRVLPFDFERHPVFLPALPPLPPLPPGAGEAADEGKDDGALSASVLPRLNDDGTITAEYSFYATEASGLRRIVRGEARLRDGSSLVVPLMSDDKGRAEADVFVLTVSEQTP